MEKSDQTIAQVFKQTEFSQLIRQGQPEVYLLTAQEYSISSDIRFFEIGAPNQTSSNRECKVIILMGATGSGKSTLINGMVNYILGVKWNYSFRFECVREDDSVSRNQAYSQTSSVTAYTIHHQEGMTVPYSITIIDTPGYGDTRGVARDKEITKTIHQFLMEKDAQIDHIHAACFVAASGDSRLTATQRYVLDSVLSVFGKDFRENIRLLVTFADTADPPVIEACRAAHFPMDSLSTGITYSKFNSSVLFVSNEGDEDACFDKLFWDMGQENFQIFFTMLEGMNGRDLKSTRQVIQQRQQLEQSLKEIDDELEICFVNIENMDLFLEKIAQNDHKIENNLQDLVVDKTEIRKVKEACENEFVAYNCLHCKITCQIPTRFKNPEDIYAKKQCEMRTCKCPARSHAYQRFIWRIIPVKVKATIDEMKADYESNYKHKLKTEELVVKCMEEVKKTKAKVIDLLNQVGASGRFLDSTALRSNALTPSDYLSLMRSRVAEQQAPGYLTRLETLTELQESLLTVEKSDSQVTAAITSVEPVVLTNGNITPPPKPPRCPPIDLSSSLLPAIKEEDENQTRKKLTSQGGRERTEHVIEVQIPIESDEKEEEEAAAAAATAAPLLGNNSSNSKDSGSSELDNSGGRKNQCINCFRNVFLLFYRMLRFLFRIISRLASYLYEVICCVGN